MIISLQLACYTAMMPKVSNVYSQQPNENTDAGGIAHFYYCVSYFENLPMIMNRYQFCQKAKLKYCHGEPRRTMTCQIS
jgi:hypothetical protein